MSSQFLSPWAKNIAPSPTLAVDAKAKALKAAGEDVCGFGAGEPDFDTPQFIKDACAQALADGKTKYAAALHLDFPSFAKPLRINTISTVFWQSRILPRS